MSTEPYLDRHAPSEIGAAYASDATQPHGGTSWLQQARLALRTAPHVPDSPADKWAKRAEAGLEIAMRTVLARLESPESSLADCVAAMRALARMHADYAPPSVTPGRSGRGPINVDARTVNVTVDAMLDAVIARRQLSAGTDDGSNAKVIEGEQ